MWIRERREGDAADLLAGLHEAHRRDRYPVRPGNVSWAWICAPSVGPAWVAEVDGRAAGHIALAAGGPAVRGGALSLTRFFVRDAARGTGIGSALLSAAEQYARDAGISLVLDVLDGSDSAIRLYEKHGWTRFDTVRADWTGPDGNHPVLHFYAL